MRIIRFVHKCLPELELAISPTCEACKGQKSDCRFARHLTENGRIRGFSTCCPNRVKDPKNLSPGWTIHIEEKQTLEEEFFERAEP